MYLRNGLVSSEVLQLARRKDARDNTVYNNTQYTCGSAPRRWLRHGCAHPVDNGQEVVHSLNPFVIRYRRRRWWWIRLLEQEQNIHRCCSSVNQSRTTCMATCPIKGIATVLQRFTRCRMIFVEQREQSSISTEVNNYNKLSTCGATFVMMLSLILLDDYNFLDYT